MMEYSRRWYHGGQQRAINNKHGASHPPPLSLLHSRPCSSAAIAFVLALLVIILDARREGSVFGWGIFVGSVVLNIIVLTKKIRSIGYRNLAMSETKLHRLRITAKEESKFPSYESSEGEEN